MTCGYRWSTLEIVLLNDATTLDVREAIHKAIVLTDGVWSLLGRARDLLGGVPVPDDDDV
jgi:hypothetical protein